MAAKGVGMLEADPAALAIVFVFFLVFTLGFEKILHHITHALKKRKKLGMLAAVNNFTSEIMLLGLAILLLMVCEERIAQICHPIKPPSYPPSNKGLQPWLSRVVGTKEVKGCACCLAKTKGVSKCFLKTKGCPELKKMKEICEPEGVFRRIDHVSEVIPANYTSYSNSTAADKQLNGTAGGGESAKGKEKGRRRRQLLAEPEGPELYSGEDESPQCIGSMQEKYAECGYQPGMAPWVTVKTLHQVHMLLFFLAITHITMGVVVLLISTIKLKYYAKRGGMSGEDKLAATAIRAAQADFDEKMSAGLLSFRSSVAPPHSGHKNSSSSGGAVAKDRAAADGEMPSAFATAAAADGAAADAAARGQQKDGDVVDVLEPWNGRPDHMRFFDWLVEIVVYVVRQVCLWNTVDKQEYSVLRACFYYTHTHTLAVAPGHASHDDHLLEELQHTHTLAATLSMASAESMSGSDTHLRPENARGSYGPYLTEMVERDGSEVVGLGLPMWLFVIVFVLVSGVIGWAAWMFLIFAGALLLFINLILLTTLRHMTKGGRLIRQEEAWYHWLHRKGFLLGSIKLTLFFFTFVISNAIFMAANFGPESCFFSRTGFQKNPVPWWIIMLIDICLLLNLGLFTLPLYSLTSHSLKVDKALLQDIVRDRILQEAFAEVKKSHLSGNKGGSGGNSRGGSGGGHGGVKGAQQQQQRQPKRSLSRHLTWAWSASSKGHSVKFQQADSRPLSDDKHFQRIQETLSV